MEDFKWKLEKFMKGRNGPDELGRDIGVASIIIYFFLLFDQHKAYRIFKCKGCGRRIRVPKGKGKVEITCPLCEKKIIRRT